MSRSRSTEAPRQSRERLAGGEAGAPAGVEPEVVVVAGAWVLMGGEWVGEASGLMEGPEEEPMRGTGRPCAMLVTGCSSGRLGGSM